MTSITSNIYPIKGYALDDVEYYPEPQVISMDNRRKYTYTDNKVNTLTGVTGAVTGYPFQVVNIQPNDVILLQISDDLDLFQCKSIQQEMNETFPNNTVILCNSHVLKGLTVLRGETEKISDTVDIKTTVDVDKIFDTILKGHPNDFLY